MSRSGRRRRGIFPRYSAMEDVDREIRAHLEMRAAELMEEGWEPAEARAEARRLFGNVDAVAQECAAISRSRRRAVERGRMMGAFWQDVRYALRSLVKAPGFTVVALVTLALGIGANTAIFSVLNGVLLRPLPYPDPDELVWVRERSARGGTMAVAWANFRDWRSASSSFDAMAAYGSSTTTVLGGDQPVSATVAFASEDLWRVFAVRPAAGRLFVAADHDDGAAPVAVVSRAFARRVLGDDAPLGRSVEVLGVTAQVVGVVDDEAAFPAGTEVWTPMTPQGESRTAHNWSVVGRLRDGVTVEAAAREVDALTTRIVATVGGDEPSEYLAVGATALPLHERLVGDVRRPLLILMAAAGFVLLVACTNLASTLLARATTRATELAVRSALGAGRRRLAGQLLTESLVLAVGGAVAGVGVAALALTVLRRVGAASVPRLEAVSLDLPVLVFTLALAVGTALAFGLLPAMRATEGAQAGALRSRRGGEARRGGTWSALVATEVALALVLLAGSGLLLRSFAAVMSEEAGFDATDVALTPVALSGVKYPELTDFVRTWDALLERAGALPGASAVGLIAPGPVAGFAASGRVAVDGDDQKSGDAIYVVASRGAFEALDIPLLRGRLFEDGDGPDAPHVAVVSRSFADLFWPGQDPLGRLVDHGGMDNYWDADPPVYGIVVGVVEDVRFRSLTREGEPTVYWHYRQRPFRARYGALLVAEAATGAPSSVASGLGSAVREVDPDVVVELRGMDDLVADSVAERRFLLAVLASFAGLGLVLAGVGIYGVVSYAVARRTREMGIRLALGAAPASVRSLVLGGALRPVVVGLLVGTAGAVALSRFMTGFLYEVPPTDPVTFTVMPLILLGAAFLASWIPARRGTRVDPIQAMRVE